MASDIITRNVDNYTIAQRRRDGYVNLTAIAKASGKRLNNYTRSKATKAFLDKVKKETGVYPIITIRSGRNEDRGTWGTLEVAERVRIWATGKSKSSHRYESYHREQLAKRLKGETEVSTLAGNCDVVTHKYAIEVKEARRWKSAIGQAQVYAYFLKKKPGIYLIGQVPEECQEICEFLQIKIFE